MRHTPATQTQRLQNFIFASSAGHKKNEQIRPEFAKNIDEFPANKITATAIVKNYSDVFCNGEGSVDFRLYIENDGVLNTTSGKL